MARSKSLIPPGAQIPAAVVLGVVFALLLAWKLGPRRKGPPTATSAEAVVQSMQETVSLDDLRAILVEVRKTEFRPAARSVDLPSLARNPFMVPEEALAEMRSGDVARLARSLFETPAEEPGSGEAAVEETVRAPSRKERLQSIGLSATCVTARQRIAIVNGQVLRPGDTVEGFVVKEIRQRELALEDEEGVETIGMEGEPRP
ncbi:MAG TPA: hypothetical protein VM492_05835 [Sumerlaeia bacterium]|nr:hypothetical protein [Sumerlaeia bacterium]